MVNHAIGIGGHDVVVSPAGAQAVRPHSGPDEVASCSPDDHIVSPVAVEDICAVAANEKVVSRFAAQCDPPCRTGNQAIPARPTVEPLVYLGQRGRERTAPESDDDVRAAVRFDLYD